MELYKKYRPANLEEIVGQEEVVEQLKSMLARERKDFPHSMLFCGPHGVGKTTFARIVANELGAKNTDFTELDSGQFRGIDTIREIRRETQYYPRNGNCMVWLLDEVHELTKVAQDALLKLLEETPSHVYIILATTNPEALISTVKSRCTTFYLHSLTPKEIYGLLKRTVEKENKTIPKEVLKRIAIDALGAARDAMVILDAIIDLPEEKMLSSAERQATQQNESIELCRLLIKGASWKKVSNVLKGLQKEGDVERIRRHVLSYASAVLLNQDNARAYLILNGMSESFYSNGFPGLVEACYTITTS